MDAGVTKISRVNAGSYLNENPGCGVILWYISVALIEGYQNPVRLWLCTHSDPWLPVALLGYTRGR